MRPEYGDKTKQIIALLSKGWTARRVMARVGCSLNQIYKTARIHEAEITKSEKPAPAEHFDIPAIDPLQPAAPQLLPLAGAVLAKAVEAGNNISVRQLQAACLIVKYAQRGNPPPPVSRKMTMMLDSEMKFCEHGGKLVPQIYGVKP